MMQNKKFIHNFLPLAPLSYRLLRVGLPYVLLSVLRLAFEVTCAIPFSAASAADFGAMLEFPVAALMILSCTVLLVDALCKRGLIQEK